jgi:membrane-associated phospholipid phosphatase
VNAPPAPMAGTVAAGAARPWGRALAWLAFLTPFFYATYGAANWLAAHRLHVGSIVFDWEHSIPFLGWTIIPYWSINAFYGLSLLLCRTPAELDTHGRRLLTAQVIAVTCFVLLPLRFTFAQPQTDGISGFLFAALLSFDQPYNQAPSLHIALLVILWAFYAPLLPRQARAPLHLWFALVGLSVLTTYQHHFIDIPTGALLGAVCLWLWPTEGSPLAAAAFTRDRRRRTLAMRYLLGGAACTAAAVAIGGAALWLLWPAVSLALVAASYAALGPAGFGKAGDGRMGPGALLLLAPYLLGAFVNSRLWTLGEPVAVPIAEGVSLGRIPTRRTAALFASIVDLCAELPGPSGVSCRAFPMLDLVTPPPDRLRQAALAIEHARAAGPLLVCCALGYSRSAAAMACWLLITGRAESAEAAAARIRRVRPRIVLDAAAVAAIAEAAGPVRISP